MGVHIITGNPRSGKTLWAVNLINETIKQGTRPVYTNITGLKIEGVREAPPDWNEVPNGSMVIYDEAQELSMPVTRDTPRGQVTKDELIYAATAKAGFETDPWLKNISTHGKRGIDLYFISQHPTLIHHQLRKMVVWHKHFVRTMGMERSTIYTVYAACKSSIDKTEERRGLESQSWKYPKNIYSLFHSADVHNVKTQIPRKLIIFASIMLFTLAYGVYWFFSKDSAVDDAKAESGKTFAPLSLNGSQQALPSDFKNPTLIAINQSPVQSKSVLGCVSGRFCRCFDQDGYVLDISESMCRNMAEGNLAIPIRIPVNNGGTKNGT